MTRYRVSLILIGILLHGSILFAAQMTFNGTLNEPPPCTISSDQTVTVSFGDNIGVNKVDGNNYLQTVDYKLTCEPDSPQSGLTLVLNPGSSGQSSFDTAAVNTSSPGLGIRLIASGGAITFGQPYPVSDVNNPPILQAVPVKDEGATLTEGPFTATATLQVVYQ